MGVNRVTGTGRKDEAVDEEGQRRWDLGVRRQRLLLCELLTHSGLLEEKAGKAAMVEARGKIQAELDTVEKDLGNTPRNSRTTTTGANPQPQRQTNLPSPAARYAAERQRTLVDSSGAIHEKDPRTGQWEPKVGPFGTVKRDVNPITGTPNVRTNPFTGPEVAREPFNPSPAKGANGGPLFRRP